MQGSPCADESDSLRQTESGWNFSRVHFRSPGKGGNLRIINLARCRPTRRISAFSRPPLSSHQTNFMGFAFTRVVLALEELTCLLSSNVPWNELIIHPKVSQFLFEGNRTTTSYDCLFATSLVSSILIGPSPFTHLTIMGISTRARVNRLMNLK